MYESKSAQLLPGRVFALRLAGHALAAAGLLIGSLALGVLGYMRLEQMSFVDALLNSSMLLGGMGPVTAPLTAGGKYFASFYALFSGMVFLVVAGIMFAPVAHRLLHRFHLDG